MKPKFLLPYLTGPSSCPIFWTRWIPRLISFTYVLMLLFLLRLGLVNGLLPLGFRTKTLYKFLFSPIRATYLTNVVVLEFVTLVIFGEEPGNLVGVVTGLRTCRRLRNCASIPDRCRIYFLEHPLRLWGLTSWLFSDTGGALLFGKSAGAWS